MGHGSHVLNMLFIIIFFFISFYFTHNLVARSSFIANKVYHTGNNNKNNNINKWSSVSHSHNKALILEKFRFLLGVGSTTKSRNGEYSTYNLSPSPSPSHSPAEAPSPAHSPVTHRRAHPPTNHHHTLPQALKKKDEGKNKATRRAVAAALASVGIASVLCAIALFFGCRRFKKQRRKQRRSRGGGLSKFMSSQSSVKKVSSDPGPDLFYLHSLESALEPEKCCLKLNPAAEKTICEIDEREGSNKKLIDLECESGGACYSFGEITTVHEISESFNHEIVDGEAHHSSDDESFHSFCNSPPSQLRLSNASACSLSENSEILSKETPPPPPPPPPLPPSSLKMKPNSPNPPTLPTLPKRSFPVAASAPPPPCPPPPLKAHFSSLNAPPPPPPSQLTQQIPLGKDGSPLPKLKPLHWDKVRAAPNRSSVWDKLRSSSFE